MPRNGTRLRATLVIFPSDTQKNSRRLELSISENTPHGRCRQGPGSVDPRFPAGLPFPVPEILEFVAFRDPGKIFQQFSRDFPGVFPENHRTDPGNSHSLLEFSEIRGHRFPSRALRSPCRGPLLTAMPAIPFRKAQPLFEGGLVRKATTHCN